MRISDWSSDVCSSDLHPPPAAFGASAVTAAPDIGVLLVNLGTPDAPEPGSVRRYLAQFLSDRLVVEIPPLVWQPILRGIVLSTRPPTSAHPYRTTWTDRSSPTPAHPPAPAEPNTPLHA